MNKYQEALENVKADRQDIVSASANGYIPYTTLDEISLLQELVDKATPKAIIMNKQGEYECPNCHSHKVELYNYLDWKSDYLDFCPDCGQALT